MGRRVPNDGNVLIHPVLSSSLLVASLAATMAIIVTLCGFRSRKSPSPSSASQDKATENSCVVSQQPSTTEMMSKPLPPPPAVTALELGEGQKKLLQFQEQQQLPARLKESYSANWRTNSKGKQRLAVSLSMRMPRSMSVKYQARKEEKQQQKCEKWKPEDSIWKKTIILGEKCRVPDEDDAILYDEKGHRISTFHPKTPRSLPVSRTNSCIDPEAFPR